MKRLAIAVVGATGAVGIEILRWIKRLQFPATSILALASSKSRGRKVEVDGTTFFISELTPESFNEIDLAFFSAGKDVSRIYVPIALQKGAMVIDNTSYYRQDPLVPLVASDVNLSAIRMTDRLIANPNCSTLQMTSVLAPIHRHFGIKRIIVSTYQSVSGAGHLAVEELKHQSMQYLEDLPIKSEILPVRNLSYHHPIAFNVIPQVDEFLENGYSKEEMKMVNETHKILDPSIIVNATCVRVPVFRCHSESIYLETSRPLTSEMVKGLFTQSPTVEVVDDPHNGTYPQAIYCVGSPKVYVGRIRNDLVNTNAMSLWIVSDNLLKGAATNAIEIAMELVRRGMFL